MSIAIKEVTCRKDLKKYVKFRNDLYKGNPYYVPVLIDEQMTTLDRQKNPAFEVCDVVLFMAYKDEELVGTITGIINRKSNEIWHQKNARFGFVDFIEDLEVTRALFGAVEAWARKMGMEALHGPLGFTDMDEEGMLIEGFDQLGTMAAIYNYPYYPQYMTEMGFVKDHDWQEFKIYIPEKMPEKHERISNLVRRKFGLKVLKFKKSKEIWPYARKIFKTLNAAYSPLFGFAPLTDKQIEYYVKMYIPMLRLDLVTIILRESDDEVVGFGISLPNLSRAMQKAKGRLFPFGFIPLLKGLYSKPKVIDLYLVGVLPEYHNKGVNALLFEDLIPIYQQLGVEYAETNPELESNQAVQSQWEYFQCEHHKTRRAFIKKL